MMSVINRRSATLFALFVIATASVSGAQTKVSEAVESAVVLLCHTKPEIENALGTGFLVGPDGLVVTADHVIFDEKSEKIFQRIYAIRYTGVKHRYFRVTVLRRFRDGTKGRDLALLRSTQPAEAGPPHLQVGASTGIGNEIWIAGFPLVFSQVKVYPFIRRGSVVSTRFSYEGHSVLVLDLPSVPGFSGSPVVDISSGKVVAVVRGSPKERRSTDFTVATVIDYCDLQPNLKKPPNKAN